MQLQDMDFLGAYSDDYYEDSEGEYGEGVEEEAKEEEMDSRKQQMRHTEQTKTSSTEAEATNFETVDLTGDPIEAWLIRLSDGDYKSDTARPRVSIINRSVIILAAQINHRSELLEEHDAAVMFKERMISNTIECGNIFKCHGRDLAFVGVAHLTDPVVSSRVHISLRFTHDLTPSLPSLPSTQPPPLPTRFFN